MFTPSAPAFTTDVCMWLHDLKYKGYEPANRCTIHDEPANRCTIESLSMRTYGGRTYRQHAAEAIYVLLVA